MRLTARQAHLRVALFLGLFLGLHFATHFAALGGVDRHGAMLEAGRAVYRVPLVEGLLVAALALQVVLGVTLVCSMARWPQQGGWRKAQKWSGIVLAVFIVLHTSAALGSRWLLGLDTNFYWAAGTLTLAGAGAFTGGRLPAGCGVSGRAPGSPWGSGGAPPGRFSEFWESLMVRASVKRVGESCRGFRPRSRGP